MCCGVIRDRLFSMQDVSYREFHSRLMPNIDKDSIIGVRIPSIKKYAKELFGKKEADLFLRCLPHVYYEENNLHAFLIGGIKDFDQCISELERFLPYVDNWATCDSLRPCCFKSNKQRLLSYVDKWLRSAHPFTVRFGIEVLMVYYLDGDFEDVFLESVAKIRSEDYYVKMMIAWYFATALAKQWDGAIKYLENRRLDEWVHQKTIQKARESFRISDPQKEYLKSLKNH